MNALGKIQRTFVRDEAYLMIRDMIVEGKLEPGRKLRDKDLADELGVSRTPVREALLRLENEGLVHTKANSSTQVAPLDSQDAFHLYSIVWTLESLALEQGFLHFQNEDVEKMVEANEAMLKAMEEHDNLGAVQADTAFHDVIIQLAQNPELSQIVATLKQKLKRIDLYYFEKKVDGQQSYKEHKKIIAALKRKDFSEATKALQNNWKESFSRIKF